MNVGQSISWQRVAAFLRGELDHEDESTRADIARACEVLDTAANKQLGAGKADDTAAWDEHLCYVTTEAR